MKSLLIFLGFVAFASAQQQLAVPQTCTDIFSQDTCDKLVVIAQKFGESIDDINAAIQEAAKQHIQTAKDVLAFVKEYLVSHVKSFKCENVLPAEQCAKLTKIAGLLKLKADQMKKAIEEAIVNGATTTQAIFQAAVEYARDILSTTTCEDILTADQCTAIANFAKMAHLNAHEVIKAVREAVIEGFTSTADITKAAIAFLRGEITCEGILGKDLCDKLAKAAAVLGENMKDITEAVREAVEQNLSSVKDILDFVQQFLVDKAKNFKCEDVLTADMCKAIDTIGGHFKDGIAVVNKAIKEAIVHGATGMQEIYNVAIAWMRDNVLAKKCEDLIDAATCNAIRDFAKKVHVSVTDVMTAVKEAIASGAWGPDLLQKAIEYIKDKISCEAVMGKATCDSIRALADKFGVSLATIDKVIRDAVASGMTKVSDLYKTVVKYIYDKWTDIFGDEEIMMIAEKRGILDFDVKAFLKKQLMKVVDKVLDELKVDSTMIRAQIKAIIANGKVRFDKIRQKIIQLLAAAQGDEESDTAVAKVNLREELKKALEQAKGFVKILIEKLLKLSKAKLAKARDLIKKILAAHGAKDLSIVDGMLEVASDTILNDMANDMHMFTELIVADMHAEAHRHV